MRDKVELLEAYRRTSRSLVNGMKPSGRAAQNWMGAVGFGSFAYLGREVSDEAPPATPRSYLSVEVGERCELRCRHCIYHREEPVGQEPSALVEKRLSSAVSRDFDPLWVSFAGKEPTLFPEQLLRQAASVHRHDRTNILMTNGLRLSGALLQRLAEVIDYFDISIDGDEAAHDWMRGKGTFGRTWRNVEAVVEETDRGVGLIATQVHARLPSGRPQYEDLAALALRLRSAFGGRSRVMLSISLYYGPPGDPLLLDADDIVALLALLAEISFPVRLLLTANYAHLWPEISDAMGWGDVRPVYDVPTGFAMIQRGSLSLVLFNLSACPQIGLRVSNDGRVYLSCNHLALGEQVADLHVADLHSDELDDIAQQAMDGSTRYSGRFDHVADDCDKCGSWSRCFAGDRLSGIYFDGIPADPYCTHIARSKL